MRLAIRVEYSLQIVSCWLMVLQFLIAETFPSLVDKGDFRVLPCSRYPPVQSADVEFSCQC